MILKNPQAPALRWKIGDLAISEMAGGWLTQRLGREAGGPTDYGRPRGGHLCRSVEMSLAKPDFKTLSGQGRDRIVRARQTTGSR